MGTCQSALFTHGGRPMRAIAMGEIQERHHQSLPSKTDWDEMQAFAWSHGATKRTFGAEVPRQTKTG